MPSGVLSLKPLRLTALWLVALVLAHALAPTGPGPERPSGSAFNAFTVDVTLGPPRAASIRDAARAERDPHPGTASGLIPIRPEAVRLSSSPRAGLQGPRLAAVPSIVSASPPPPARAPPLA